MTKNFRESSVIKVFNTKTGEPAVYKGLEGAKAMFAGLYALLTDLVSASRCPNLVAASVWRRAPCCRMAGLTPVTHTHTHSLNWQSDMGAPLCDVDEENMQVFLVWKNPASGVTHGADTFVLAKEEDGTVFVRQQTVFIYCP